MTETSNNELIRALLKPQSYSHPVEQVELVETHISWVLLTGDFVYKIKKPVDFGFLDFSTLERRRFFCEEELRLNQRLAHELYLAVVPIGGTPGEPVLNASEGVFEYAVQMRQFPQSQQLDRVLARGELRPQQLDNVAILLAGFHQRIASVAPDQDYGDPEHVYRPVSENFQQITQHLPDDGQSSTLLALQEWSERCFDQVREIISQRKSTGFVRECHGDLHLSNLAWYRDAPLVFDCIEFNPNLYWIDVMNDIAFLVMDLQDRDQWSLAYRLLNLYLQRTGDYEGVSVLKFYLVYRAMVLAKVNAIRLAQAKNDRELIEHSRQEFLNYIDLAVNYIHQAQPMLVIMRGLSASGKSRVSGKLLEGLGAIRIRSDVERKRLYGIDADERASADPNTGIYTPEANRKTYDRLHELAGVIVQAGYTAIVDAAFLRRHERERFHQLALQHKTPYVILEVTAPEHVLRQRITGRQNDVSDATLDVLEQQLSSQELLSDDERSCSITVDTSREVDMVSLVEQVLTHAGRVPQDE